MSEQPKSKEQWGSRIGVILAVAGSAVGLGNFLRFPGQAAQNGGGAFMLPYFISLLVLGIPLCWAEWTMGRYGGLNGFNSAPGIYSTIWRNRWSKYFGAIALLLPLVIYMYYVLIEAWCLGYAIRYLTGDLVAGSGGAIDTLAAQAKQAAETPISDQEALSKAFESFFNYFVGAEANGALLSPGRRNWLLILVGVFAFNFMLIYRGVTKGIESFCKVAMPVMIVLALIVLVRVLTLGTPDPTKPDQSVLGGLNFMWSPKGEALKDPKTWLAASGQIFFSLSVGFGIIINYASYLRESDDVVLSGLTSSSMNEFFEVCLGGLITLPAAFIFLGPAVGEQGTFGLGFVALPNVFAQMAGGKVFGFLWFFMLFIAAVTSSVSMLQPVIAFLEEGFNLRRRDSAAFLGLLAAIGCGITLYLSEGLVALDTMDFWVGSVMIFVLALVQAILYGWAMGIMKGEDEAHKGANIRIPVFVQYMLKYVVPCYLLVIFIAFCFNNAPGYLEKISNTPAALASVLFILVIIGFLLMLIRIAGRRWEREGRLNYDPEPDGAPKTATTVNNEETDT
ncbi:sodium-dependent transporter [Thalassoroseus pseudoceratinae]|uniref:sodium-dependent transporter n=1 Tax=Thalassoroseus pseudoceratinae TaxID=2713176 RepID=UPI0014203DDD|nr:sodium-dependent transporter [Thalassoroseus pseudoceratinae]